MDSPAPLLRLSIVIPFRDQVAMLNDCLKSLEDSCEEGDFEGIEVLLIDNQSSVHELANLHRSEKVFTRLIQADIAFNFQAIMNLGAREAKGQFLLLLNNDIVFPPESRGWLARMIEVAARPEVAAVGPCLMYPDGTIQHAGVVVGLNTYADHLYRGFTPAQSLLFPYLPFDQDRYVSAVTAACLMIEKKKFDEVNGMDERFIMCGGDVDLCLRLHMSGYKNVYLGGLRLIHLESKTRRSEIPPSDFVESRRSYDIFLKNYAGRDPYYPAPLELRHLAPSQGRKARLLARLKTMALFILKCLGLGPETLWAAHRAGPRDFERLLLKRVSKLRQRLMRWGRAELRPSDLAKDHPLLYQTLEPVRHYPDPRLEQRPRLNILVPHLNPSGIFGGVLTALVLGILFKQKYFATVDLRFVLTDQEGGLEPLHAILSQQIETPIDFAGIEVFSLKGGHPLPVHAQDFFAATAWWTAWPARELSGDRPFVYLIQDYESCFYPWSERFALCDETYSWNYHAIFNTRGLRDFFIERKILPDPATQGCDYFEPALNREILKHERTPKKTQTATRTFFFYGRPSVERNLFSLGLVALQGAYNKGAFEGERWRFISAGEKHDPFILAPGLELRSAGKLSLQSYFELLSKVDVGLSLMLSPHPSYPPLELAAAGAEVVTNRYVNKDLSLLATNILSCDPTPASVEAAIIEAVKRSRVAKAMPRMAFNTSWAKSFETVLPKLAQCLEI